MIARLNLSSHPFRNRTLPWATAAAVSVASLLLLLYALTTGQEARAQGDSAERSVLQLRKERADIEAQAREIRQSVPPEQREPLEAAHALADRKAFSWSKLFADLEEVMPSEVRLQRISVNDVAQRGGEMRAELDMTVESRTYESVTGMTSAMYRLGSFATTHEETQKADRGDNSYVWRLTVNYVQRSKPRAEGGDERAEARD